MEHIARLERCRELFAMSRWGQAETHLTYYDGELGETEPWERDADNRKNIPAYDLGYLLRKFAGKGGIELRYGDQGCIALSHMWRAEDTTPEDAVCLLAMTLFEQGIFSRESTR